MTHSLHRTGSVTELERDYVVMAMLAKGFNDSAPDARKRLLCAGKIFQQHGPVNIMKEELWTISPVVSAVYDDKRRVQRVLKDLKDADLGISIVVSGLVSEIQKMLRELELTMHTVHLSLGIFGRKELLPPDDVLEITTTCGHHCVSPASIMALANKITSGKITADDAAKVLAKQCICGIFNTTRTMSKLIRLASQVMEGHDDG